MCLCVLLAKQQMEQRLRNIEVNLDEAFLNSTDELFTEIQVVLFRFFFRLRC